MKLRTLFTILVLAMAACAPAPTATPSSTPTATHTATATFTPSATATLTPMPTVTPTPFALQKSGLESITIESVCLNIKSAHFAGEIMEVIQAVLASVGVQTTSIGEKCDAVLAVDVNFRALSATYTFMTTIDGNVTDTSTATCYNGATADGEIRLSHSSSFTQFNPFVAEISARREPPDTLSSSLGSSDVCATDPEDANFDRVRYKVITDIFDGLVQLWGDQALLGALTHTATDDLARGMFKARSEELLPMLVERFLHGSSSDQLATALALVAAGEVDEVDAVDLVPILAGGLEAANPMVREAALIALDDLDMAAKDALPALEHVAREDTDETLQNKARSILRKLAPERFSEAAILVQELAEKDTYYQARSRLVNMGGRAFPALFRGLQDENPVIRSRVISILGEMGKPVFPELREALASEVTLVRAGAIGVVSAMSGTIPEDIATAIVDALEDESAEVRQSALRTIIVRSGEFSEEEERRALVQALYEDDFEKMEWAVHRFIMYDILPPADTAAAIGRVLVESKESKTRQEAAIVLWKMGADTVDAVPALILGLDDESGNTRRYVAQTLIQLGPEAAPAIPKLIEKLEDPDTGVRIDAAKALGTSGPAAIEAVPALIARLDDPDAEVRSFSAQSLTVLTGEDFGEDIEQWRRWWDEQE